MQQTARKARPNDSQRFLHSLNGDFLQGLAGVNALHDLFDGLVFDEQIANFKCIENLANQIGGGHAGAIETNPVGKLIDLLELETIAGERLDASELARVFNSEFDLLGAQQFLLEQIERAVIKEASVVDNHDAAAKFFNVVEIVGGEQDGGLKFAVDRAEEFADLI